MWGVAAPRWRGDPVELLDAQRGRPEPHLGAVVEHGGVRETPAVEPGAMGARPVAHADRSLGADAQLGVESVHRGIIEEHAHRRVSADCVQAGGEGPDGPGLRAVDRHQRDDGRGWSVAGRRAQGCKEGAVARTRVGQSRACGDCAAAERIVRSPGQTDGRGERGDGGAGRGGDLPTAGLTGCDGSNAHGDSLLW